MGICDECVGDPYLISHIAANGEIRECTFGHGERRSITLEELAGIVDPAYRQYHQPGDWILVPLPDDVGDHDHTQLGDDPETLLAEILRAEPEVVDALLDHLADLEAYEVAKEGVPAMYDSAENYVFVPPSAANQVQTWDRFASRVKHQRRFLDPENMSDLASIFGDPEEVAEAPWLSVQTLEPEQNGAAVLYRARRCATRDDAWKVLSHPVAELGSPPPASAAAGRMNPAGISVFYAAFEKETAISEVRPWVSALVVVGGFRVTRPLQLLDLSGLQGLANSSPSLFSGGFDEGYSRWRFLIDFEDIVSRPVGPHESEIEFLPTQIVAEYVHSVLGLDGIVYGSAQNEGEGTNAVVFPQHEADPPVGLQLIYTTVECVEVTANVTTFTSRADLQVNDLAVLFDQFPKLTRFWNDNQMVMITAILDPSVSYEVMATRLREVLERGTLVVTSMGYLAASLDDEEVQAAVMAIVENFQERLGVVREIVGAAMTWDDDALELLQEKYAEITHAERLRPLLNAVYGHDRVRPLVTARGFNLDRFVEAFLGSF